MKIRLVRWTLSVFVLFSIFQSVHIVKADDDDMTNMKSMKVMRRIVKNMMTTMMMNMKSIEDMKMMNTSVTLIGNLKYETGLLVKGLYSHFGIHGQGRQSQV